MARETLDYVIREMQEPNGAYFSATDADSEGVEGKFSRLDAGRGGWRFWARRRAGTSPRIAT